MVLFSKFLICSNLESNADRIESLHDDDEKPYYFQSLKLNFYEVPLLREKRINA